MHGWRQGAAGPHGAPWAPAGITRNDQQSVLCGHLLLLFSFLFSFVFQLFFVCATTSGWAMAGGGRRIRECTHCARTPICHAVPPCARPSRVGAAGCTRGRGGGFDMATCTRAGLALCPCPGGVRPPSFCYSFFLIALLVAGAACGHGPPSCGRAGTAGP